MVDDFTKRKRDILSKDDKSNKGGWDKPIIELCEIINKKRNYYTTSSCSGRIVLLKDQEDKGPGLFFYLIHELVSYKKLKHELSKVKGNVKFKQEPPILHVACKTLSSAQSLLKKAQTVGFKRSGIISVGKRVMVELISTEKLEFPIMKKGNTLIGEEFLREIVEKSNKNLSRGWKKIDNLINVL